MGVTSFGGAMYTHRPQRYRLFCQLQSNFYRKPDVKTATPGRGQAYSYDLRRQAMSVFHSATALASGPNTDLDRRHWCLGVEVA